MRDSSMAALLGYFLGALLDPFFMLPAWFAAWLIRDVAAGYVVVTIIAALSALLVASLSLFPSPEFLAVAFLSRIMIALGLVWVIHRLRKPSTPSHT